MSGNPFIERKQIGNSNYLYFTFKGTFRRKEAEVAIEQWKEIFEKETGNPALVWNCLEMKDYEPMARIAWQKAIKELKSQIDVIWLITNSPLIKSGAKLMSMFTSYNMRVAKSEEDILLRHSNAA